MSVQPNSQTISRHLDALPVGRMHVAVVLVACLGLFIDIAELSLNAVFSTSFPDTLAFVPAGAQSLLLGSVFAGGIIGAPLFGLVADRFGRRLAMLTSMALVGVCSIAAALSPTHQVLIGFRFLSGIALGAYPPLMTAWLTDILPPSRRATIILGADALGFLGAPAIVFVVYRLNGLALFGPDGPHLEAWRLALLGCAVIAFVSSVGFWLLPDSPRWLAAAGRFAAARRALDRLSGRNQTSDALALALQIDVAPMPACGCESAPPADVQAASGTDLRRRIGMICVLYALRAVPTVVFPVMMGLVLRQKGLDLGTSLFLVATSSFGGTIGTLCAASIIERIERRAALWVFGALLIGCGVTFAAARSVEVLLFSACAFLTLGAIFGPVLSIYAAEIIPTSVRASVTASAWGLTRLVSSVLPVALLPLLAGAGPWAFMGVVLGSVAVSLGVIAGFGPRQAPRRSIV
jgi:putative MFS transporter